MDLSAIHQLVRRARVRIRIQAALDASVVALIPASFVIALAAITARWGPPEAAVALLVVAAAGMIAAAVIAVTRPLDDETIARRIDRASGLSDRLSSAIAFSEEDSEGFKQLAIADGVRAAEQARIREATPFAWPRYASAAAVSILIAGSIRIVIPGAPVEISIPDEPIEEVVVTEPALHWDVEYAGCMLGKLRVAAMQAGDRQAMEAADELAIQLHNLVAGTITKDELLSKLARAESAFERLLTREALLALEDSRDAIKRLVPEVRRGPQGPSVLPERRKRGSESEHERDPNDPDPGIGHDPIADLPDARVPLPNREVALPTDDPIASHRATIETAAVRGFAGAEYKKVYADYQQHSEQVMHTEEIPSSRRAAIRRYFDRIKPH